MFVSLFWAWDAEKQMSTIPLHLGIREMKIKTAMWCHLTPFRMNKIKNVNGNLRWRECGIRGTLHHCLCVYKCVQPLWILIYYFLRKLRINLPPDTMILSLGIFSKESCHKNTCCTIFIVTLLIIARAWKQPRWSSYMK